MAAPVNGTTLDDIYEIIEANGPGGGGAVAGDVAHDAVDSGAPVKIGAVARSAAPTAVTAGDRVNLSADLLGSLRVLAVDVNGAVLDQTATVPVKLEQAEYETVAASQTAQVLGATGATGDYLAGLLVVPATTAAGSISILDNATSISVFVSGTLSNLVPFFIPLGIKSVSGAWKVTTGAAVSVIAIGDFT